MARRSKQDPRNSKLQKSKKTSNIPSSISSSSNDNVKNEKPVDENTPSLSPVDDNSSGSCEDSVSVYDSADEMHYEGNYADEEDDDDYDDDDDVDGEEEFEDQGSSDEDDDILERQGADDEDEDEMDKVNIEDAYEAKPRKLTYSKRSVTGRPLDPKEKEKETAAWMHTDDLSSDDEDADGTANRIGRVPLHWYDEYDHIGYDVHGKKVNKSASVEGGDRLDQALANEENKASGKFVIHDALNDKNVELTARQIELIRRIQGGAFAHPEFDGNADYIDYFTGVDQEISGINTDREEPKSRFQPSKWDKLQVNRLLEKLEKGKINMDYLTGKIKDMNETNKKKGDTDQPFLLWTGAEEDELNLRRGPQHIAAPKLPPPGHAESYVPPDEYLPTKEDIEKWEEMEVKDRPHGLLIPKKFPNLRSVGAYQHSVREAFERCLDLYLCPRVMKRRLNIDPESLVPQLPKASDLRPFPTAKCVEYKTPLDGDTPPMIRCVTCSPDGRFMASGATDGYLRLWEVETGRLLRSWNLSILTYKVEEEKYKSQENNNDNGGSGEDAPQIIKPVVSLQWNPNKHHHCLLAAVGAFIVVVATGTESLGDAELTNALFAIGRSGGNVSNIKAAKAVKWIPVSNEEKLGPLSIHGEICGPICLLKTNFEVANIRWHNKGDYFVTVTPKAGAAAVLIHQLSKGNSQQPFSKAKGEAQVACFHPNKPFLFVASQQHVRIYHLVKQGMVKRLLTGCRWISSLDVHPTGDHLIVGSLDRRMIWFDLDLSHTPYKTLKYHERALRSVGYHKRYPLMASSSDDGAVHIFHSMVYSDLMRNPLIVPVKILRGHDVVKRYGVLSVTFHPTQPWIFTAGADGRIFLYQDI